MDRIRFQLDEHVPDAVAHALQSRGIDAVTASEARLLGAPDTRVLDSASAARRVLVTHDSDFLRLHKEQYQHAGIAYCQQGERSIGQIVAGLVLIYEVLGQGDMIGRVEFL